MWNMHNFGFGFGATWIGMMIFGLIRLVFYGAIIYFVIKFIAKETNNNNSSNAIEILKQRYARGEISESEYHEKMKILKK